MTSYIITEQAYVKLMLHAAKYPEKATLGLLVGEVGNELIRITDSFPLFHQPITAAPLEAATLLVEQHCSSLDKPLKIVGLYQANELVKDKLLDSTVKKIATKLESQCDRACVLLVESDRLADPDSLALQLFLKDVKKGWTLVSGKLSGERETLSSTLTRNLVEGIHHDIHDFDEHFDDISKDWRNPMLKY